MTSSESKSRCGICQPSTYADYYGFVFHCDSIKGCRTSHAAVFDRDSILPLRFIFLSAIGEELGWSRYVIDPLQDRLGALGDALVLGIVWAVWHFIPLLSAKRSLAWWLLGTVALRIIIT